MKNTKYKEFNAGRAGSGRINIATGALTFVHEDTRSDANILPINISHVYESKRALETSQSNTYGTGFRLNLQQTLKKDLPDNVNDTKYTYIDTEGIEHTFEERYYHIDLNGKKAYISNLDKITIEAGGKLTYLSGNVTYEVFTQQITESGLTLQSELKAFKGSEKLETRHDDIVQLTEEIFQLDKTIKDLKYSVKQYQNNISKEFDKILDLQKEVEQLSIAVEGDSLTDDEKKPDENGIFKSNEAALNAKRNELFNAQNSYENPNGQVSIRDSQVERYKELLTIAQEEITKYENLKAHKEDLLEKMTVQIPVNFIIDKDNLILGFNEIGNLVTLMDSYDNQVAIIYENGLISKVVDADNREIIFEYEKKNSIKGKLVSITDFKGHTTKFSYNSNSCLTQVEYPNGEITKFVYEQGTLLSEVISPSKMGAEVKYYEDNKVKSISEITSAEKIDKHGVSSCTEAVNKIAEITYDGDKTLLYDVENDITKLNLIGSDGKICCEQTLKDDRILDYTIYDSATIASRADKCNFIISADNLIGSTISDNDLMSPQGESTVTLSALTDTSAEWNVDISKLKKSNGASYFLFGSVLSSSTNETTIRNSHRYYKQNYPSRGDSYRRFEYKVVVDYSGKSNYKNTYWPIENGSIVNMLYLNNEFKAMPEKLDSDFLGPADSLLLPYYYPIFGTETFSRVRLSKQVYFKVEYYASKVDYGRSLWAGNILLWCNSEYATENNKQTGWQIEKIDIGNWGPIQIHSKSYIHNWGQFISQDGIFHNGSKFYPNTDDLNFDSESDVFIAGLDYSIHEKQHVKLPITLRKENGKPIIPKKIAVLAMYKQNQGEAVFDKPILLQGNTQFSLLDEIGNTVFEANYEKDKLAETDESGVFYTVETKAETKYNADNLPIEKRTTDIINTINGKEKQVAVEKWFYNPQNKVIEHWNYIESEELSAGIDITETVYDERGNIIKTFNYNNLDATTKFYIEHDLAEDGRIIADIDETGLYKTHYEYDDVTGKVKTIKNPNGSKLGYAHDTNTDEVIDISQSTVDGESNSTSRIYTAGYITELRSGSNVIDFEYEGKGRKSAVYLNGTHHIKYEYEDGTETNKNDVVTTTIAPNDIAVKYIVKAEFNKDGNALRIQEGNNPEELSESMVKTYYTEDDRYREGLLKTSEDKINKTKTEYAYNELQQLISTTVSDGDTNAVIASETVNYNEYGQITNRKLLSGDYTYEYGYNYKNAFSQEFENIDMPFGLSRSQTFDVNGRIKDIEIAQNGTRIATEHYYFRKHGDHGTNQISSVRYGELRSGDFVIKDRIFYTYDESGNITEIKENGKLIARYGYDALNRLIREDNAKLDKTVLFTYDNNGNILSKRESAFTLTDTPNVISFVNEREYVYDAEHADRLAGFGEDIVSGYDSIGNPTRYRNKKLTWQKGRQLKSIHLEEDGDTYTFCYDGSGRRIGKKSYCENIEYIYMGDTLIREERGDENNTIYFGDDLVSGDNFADGGGIILDGVNKTVVEYIHSPEGVVGLKYDGKEYYFRRNIQGDITRIYAIDGTLQACYTYDAWGNHKVYDAEGNINTDIDFIGNVNPYRYRGYYYDIETNLYYCQSRYYDPEVGRWINADSIEYLDSESINGLNLYAYCGNNPIMYIDDLGNWKMPNWLKWLIGGVVILGLGIATIATGGAAAGVAGFIVAGAFKGAVIGAISGALVSGTIGGINSAVEGDGFWSGFANGSADGFMSGAIIGGATGAIGSSVQVANAAKSWAATGGKSGFKQMTQHYTRHVINEGQKSVAKNIVNYTKQAKLFFLQNNGAGYLLREGVIKIAGAPGGIFNTNGLIRSFWYVLM